MQTRVISCFKRIAARRLVALSLALVGAWLGAAGCDNDDKPGAPSAPEGRVDDGCARGSLEADALEADVVNAVDRPLLASGTRWQGPGADATGALPPGNYVFGSTYIRERREEGAQARLGELSKGVIGAMLQSPGLVAFSFASSESCNASRTFTAWRDEAAMYEFVASGAHAAAMPSFGELSRGGGGFTHWAGTPAEASWGRAAEELGRETPVD